MSCFFCLSGLTSGRARLRPIAFSNFPEDVRSAVETHLAGIDDGQRDRVR